jgi:long-chain fatty acid transport protein
MITRIPIKTLVSSAVALMMNQSFAGGFSLYTEGSASAIGNYAAGVAAEASNAATGWYNPAGLVYLGTKQVVLSGVGVFPNTEISGASSYRTPFLPTYFQNFTDLQGGRKALVPALHFALPFNDRLTGGLSIVSPFGLSTEYSKISPIRYAATLTELITMNVSPELGYLVTEDFSIGGGLDLQWAKVKFNAVAGVPTLYTRGFSHSPYYFDSTSENEGDSFAMGFHVGVLKRFNQGHTRLGINYQSKTSHKFKGHSLLTGLLADRTLDNPQATFRSDTLSSNETELPSIITLSGYQDMNESLALLGSIVYQGWDVFKNTQLNNVAGFSSEGGGPTLLTINNPQKYRNSWRFALGANYKMTDRWLMRLGGGYDQTPTVNAERDVRLPDMNRWALSIGTHYQLNPALGFDVGYTYLFAAENSTINKTAELPSENTYTVNGTAKAHAQLVGLQAVWSIG